MPYRRREGRGGGALRKRWMEGLDSEITYKKIDNLKEEEADIVINTKTHL
jgi:hypothetical protein